MPARTTHRLQVGDEAPDFCLPATALVQGTRQKTEVCLHDFKGKSPVIITFYGAAFTPV